MIAIGASALGVWPLAGGILHDPPTVAVSAPSGTVSTGGPVLPVVWAYSQAQGDPQEWFRVVVCSDDGETVYFDSGWLEGDDGSFDVDVDAEGVPHDSDDVTWRVFVRGPVRIGDGEKARYQAEDSSPVTMAWGDPQCTIVEPADGDLITSPSGLTVKWSFDDDGKTQSAYRVRLLYAESGAVAFSTGWVQSSDTELELDFLLRDATVYRVEVQLKNNHGIRSA